MADLTNNPQELEVDMDLAFAPGERPWSPEPGFQVIISLGPVPFAARGTGRVGLRLQFVVEASLPAPWAAEGDPPAGGGPPAPDGGRIPSVRRDGPRAAL